MFTFTLLLFSLLLFSTTTATAQPYKATDHLLLDCGASSTTTSFSRRWDGDEHSEFLPSNSPVTSFLSTPTAQCPPPPETLYTTARIFNTTSFTYTFPVSQGPKFLRLYFYPATYSDLKANQSFFSVSSNGYSLLTNFSASLTSCFLSQPRPKVSSFFKEFIMNVKDTQFLNVTFTPSPNSYAFINGIEIVSMPENLHFNAEKFKYVGQLSGPFIDKYTALETIYRLNVGGGQISSKDDTGLYRSWDGDDNYIFAASVGITWAMNTSIVYTTNTPNYTAPELVYQIQRSMGPLSQHYNLTWALPVDSGFYYLLRLHFCNIIPQYTKKFQMVFKIFINNQTAEHDADPFFWTQGSGCPVYKDYGVYVADPDGKGNKQDLWLALHPFYGQYLDGYLNGLEVFKLNMTGNLSSPNPERSCTTPPSRLTYPIKEKKKKKKTPYGVILGCVGGGLVLFSLLVLMVLCYRRRTMGKSSPRVTSKSFRSLLPSDRCHSYTLKEVKFATDEFNENCVIGNGGFGKVYKGYMEKTRNTVAIKRLNKSSSQGFHEFQTEIAMLSKLRHVHLVSLIGYCDENGEMILVYEYMAQGTLQEHIYNTNNPPLSWKTRLSICIGAAKGLHYLHTCGKRRIIHRDVKSTNILLDAKWVAKLSDFGLSKLGSKDPLKTHVSTLVKGSLGYIDPEYCKTKQLTDKSDVYSFGVVLLEVLCSRPVILRRLSDEQVSLVTWGKSCYRRGTLHEIIDPKLSGEIAPECLRKFGEVANSCLHEEGSERPTMEDVVWGLEFALQLQDIANESMAENQ
ncbi:unnamed protein product [Lactuca saligna]|uniref:Protein kinase domain-containing protein n=1 Tax=Lactuca saligna TaxID=75948 RepID=A0AA36E4H5_LACSI|nr:unnamed protein product [Lactuca saligna]